MSLLGGPRGRKASLPKGMAKECEPTGQATGAVWIPAVGMDKRI